MWGKVATWTEVMVLFRRGCREEELVSDYWSFSAAENATRKKCYFLVGFSPLPFPFLLEATGKSGHEVGPTVDWGGELFQNCRGPQWEPKRTIFVIFYTAESATDQATITNLLRKTILKSNPFLYNLVAYARQSYNLHFSWLSQGLAVSLQQCHSQHSSSENLIRNLHHTCLFCSVASQL